MRKEFVRNPYNYDSDELSEKTGLSCPEPTLTSQEFIEEADINYIAERFMRTGEAPQVLNLPTYGDFEGTFDFQSSMNTIAQAKQEFMKLPAKVRTRFANDPAQLLEFVGDPANYDEAVKLGFIDKEKANARNRTASTETKPQNEARAAGPARPESQTRAPEKPGSEAPKGD